MLRYIAEGGYMMIPLLLCSVATIAVLIDRGKAYLANSRIDTRSLRAKVLTLLQEGRVEDAATVCASTPGPVSSVLLVGLQSYAKHKPLTSRPESITSIMEKAMVDYAAHAISAVEKRLNVLATIANAAPLLGMTGTVVGMVITFDELRKATGAALSGEAAGGISQALLTTAAGLIIALMAVIPYNYFTAAADRINLEIQEATTELLDFVATRVETGG